MTIENSLSSSLGDIFMDKIENNLHPKVLLLKSSKREIQVKEMRKVLNKVHRNLRLAMEIEDNRELLFLDTRIIINGA